MHRFANPCAAFAIFLLLLVACSGCKHRCTCKAPSDSDSIVAAAESANAPFHADNDIAMVLSSMVDAIRVGENLDSLRYNGQIILTDGQGRPLYTDVQDSPGAWSIQVVSPHHAIISNLYLGDLTPQFLTEYAVQALQLDSTALVKDQIEAPGQSRLLVYDFNGGFIGFESSDTKSNDGRTGTLMHIVLSAEESDVHSPS